MNDTTKRSKVYAFFKNIFAILGVLTMGVIALFYYMVTPHVSNVSADPRFEDVYGRTFQLKKDTFLQQYTDTKEYILRPVKAEGQFFSFIDLVEKGTQFRVAKILLVEKPLVGVSLKVIVEIDGSRFTKYKANSKFAINAKELMENIYQVVWEKGHKLKFHPSVIVQNDEEVL